MDRNSRTLTEAQRHRGTEKSALSSLTLSLCISVRDCSRIKDQQSKSYSRQGTVVPRWVHTVEQLSSTAHRQELKTQEPIVHHQAFLRSPKPHHSQDLSQDPLHSFASSRLRVSLDRGLNRNSQALTEAQRHGEDLSFQPDSESLCLRERLFED